MERPSEGEPLEIERKYLIRRPDRAELERRSVRRIEITQTYLTRGPAGETRRVRRSRDGAERWFYTEKLRQSDLVRVEREREISPEEAARLLLQADRERRPIQKERWCVSWDGHTLEIDLFPFWEDRAYCEVELRSPEDRVELPAWLSVIREVTDDPRYTNSALAREIPADPI